MNRHVNSRDFFLPLKLCGSKIKFEKKGTTTTAAAAAARYATTYK